MVGEEVVCREGERVSERTNGRKEKGGMLSSLAGCRSPPFLFPDGLSPPQEDQLRLLNKLHIETKQTSEPFRARGHREADEEERRRRETRGRTRGGRKES